jgi:hypothetical protein
MQAKSAALRVVSTVQQLKQMVEVNYAVAMAHDFSRVEGYLQFRDDFTPQETAEMKVEYCRFMALLTAYRDMGYTTPVSDMVDPFWHAHVLDTRSYHDFCTKVAGEYIHHVPLVSQSEENELMPAYLNTTVILYAEYFGELNQKYWGTKTKAECWNDD